ncbi:LuxR C-terminal-related transcriptional regulator [Ornithinimicrobium sp. Y1694]
MAAGVQYQVIYAAAVVEHEETREEVYAAVRAGEESRVLPDVPMKIVIADESAALVVRITSTTLIEGYLVQPGVLLDTLVGFFETLWGLAIPVEPTRASDDPTEQERMILRGMATGLTDEAIARELGISERTVARRISRLQDVLASRSRFQLGLQAARRGLL